MSRKILGMYVLYEFIAEADIDRRGLDVRCLITVVGNEF
jgi:hypothetical protein